MDSSEAMIALAKTHCAACAALHVADAARMPFADASFDIATFITSLEFVADAQCALKEAARVARGQVVILLLNPGHPMNAERKRKSAAANKQESGTESSVSWRRSGFSWSGIFLFCLRSEIRTGQYLRNGRHSGGSRQCLC